VEVSRVAVGQMDAQNKANAEGKEGENGAENGSKEGEGTLRQKILRETIQILIQNLN
jgi:hypothetical protein